MDVLGNKNTSRGLFPISLLRGISMQGFQEKTLPKSLLTLGLHTCCSSHVKQRLISYRGATPAAPSH